MEKFVSIGRNMMIADKYFKLYLRDALQPYNLNAAEGIVLLMMYRKTSNHTSISGNHEMFGSNTQDELIREIHYDKGVMTRTMKELEQKGFVTREPNPADSRSYLFSLTEQGIAFQETMMEILRRWNTQLLTGLSEEQLSVVESALQIMAKNTSVFYCEESSYKHNKL